MEKYLKRLHDLTIKYDEKSYMDLCAELHNAEANGYIISKKEDKLWQYLTFYDLDLFLKRRNGNE